MWDDYIIVGLSVALAVTGLGMVGAAFFPNHWFFKTPTKDEIEARKKNKPATLPSLRKGEFDLANISTIGYDPITKRPYAECHAEWQQHFEKLTARVNALRWWNLKERFSCARQEAILRQRLGFLSHRLRKR